MGFQDLAETYGGDQQIPNDILYGWLNANREDLANEAKLGIDRIPTSRLGKEVRRRAKADLVFLAAFFLWETNPFSEGGTLPISESRITEESHGVICRDFFIQKDDSKKVLDQDPKTKTRIILWPRGGMKSTIDLCDAVQWVLNFPMIRIWFITAADDLATGLLEEFKGHWIIKPDAPTLMNLFFPEYCVEEKSMGNEFEFWCPIFLAKKIKRKEPTVFASSVTSTSSGWHFEIIKGDDVASDRNSDNEDMCRKVTKAFNLRKKTLVRRGYIDLVGTRYHDVDLYGTAIEQSSIGDLTEQRGQNWIMRENAGLQTRILVARAIEIKSEVVERLEKENQPLTYTNAGKDGCTLLLPHYMEYSDLCRQYAEDEAMFEGQLNQNPRPASDLTFDRPTLLKHTLPIQNMPQRGPITQVWDFAFSKKKGRDYCTGSSVMWGEKGQMYVHDLVRDRFKPDGLAAAVVDFAAKWRPQKVAIENAAGSNFLEPEIMRCAYKTGIPEVIDVCRRIDWFAPDNQKDAKRVRMAALQPWLVNDMLWFAAYLPHLNTLYDEFERCLVDHHHDDIPDVIAQHPRYQPAMTIIRQDVPLSQLPSIDPNYNLLYGSWLTEDETPADAFGRLGMGQPVTMFDQAMAAEPEYTMEAETPMPGMPGILGGGMWG